MKIPSPRNLSRKSQRNLNTRNPAIPAQYGCNKMKQLHCHSVSKSLDWEARAVRIASKVARPYSLRFFLVRVS
ncbi:hypothetical protein NQ318_014476 [Aromia moschata]|uniref:Uncharacterized protein n=1 Tax=Aromia moschata TaxID=1265417 RepID=A0AAV8YLH1_9CUCU|nr:hypothetical protein NQ318_014476 [Aromia moschata]